MHHTPFNTKLDMHGLRVTIMGLGLHHGGLSSTLFCLQQGAEVTVTDLRSEKTLMPSLQQLSSYSFRSVFGKHEVDDFKNADLVIKGPAVVRNSPYLHHAQQVETDMSLFLRMQRGKIIAVTGTKGKSTAVALIDHCLRQTSRRSWLLGNIRKSPLCVWEKIQADDWVVLELSSFQLGDLAWLQERQQTNVFPAPVVFDPEISLVTNMSEDHQDYYADFASYRNDKLFLVKSQSKAHWAVIHDSEVCRPFFLACSASTASFRTQKSNNAVCGWYTQGSIFIQTLSKQKTETMHTITPQTLSRSTKHTETMIGITLVLSLAGISPKNIAHAIDSFPGLPHRLEHIRTINNISYINDSAATIPESTMAAIEHFENRPIVLIIGGSDKNITLKLFTTIARSVHNVILLEGSASIKIAELLQKNGIAFTDRCSSLEVAVENAQTTVRPGGVVLFSPGMASFGMYANAYERGDHFREIVMNLP